VHQAAPEKGVRQHGVLGQQLVEHSGARFSVAGRTQKGSEPKVRGRVISINRQGARVSSMRVAEATLGVQHLSEGRVGFGKGRVQFDGEARLPRDHVIYILRDVRVVGWSDGR
jgi:hypothetical protein